MFEALRTLFLLLALPLATGGCGKEDTPVTPAEQQEDPAPCQILLTAPNGGETWIEGLEYPITWSVSDCGGEVSIELLRNGALVATLTESTANDGSYSWTVAQADGEISGYKVRVTDLASGVADESDVSFEIADAPPAPDNFYCVSLTGTRTSGSSTTDIASFGWADEDCYGSIDDAMDEMSPGDQVWIDDGTYNEPVYFRSSHAGSANNYTIVRARNDGKVTLDSPGSYAALRIKNTSYVEAVGFRIVDFAELPIYVSEGSHHFKIRRCGWPKGSALISGSNHDGLMEECYAYGGPHRYPFSVGKDSYQIVYRRCLVRWDWSDTLEPQACFANYTCTDIYYQNCISLDGTDNKALDAPYDGLKSFFTPNGGYGTHYVGCISLNMDGAAGWYLEGVPGEASLSDCVAWDHRTNAADDTDGYRAFPFRSSADFGGLTATRMTIGISNIGHRPIRFDPANEESFSNSIVYGIQLDSGEYAVSGDLDEHDYNCYYGNTGGRNCAGGVGPHSLEDVDPFTNGLLSLVEIDAGSVLKTAGEGGTQIGAQITTRTGVSGTLYGEPGWDVDTGEPLWPFPYEDQIREDCRQYSLPPGAAYGGSPAMDGTRGFCAAGQTLTSYILNYLDEH